MITFCCEVCGHKYKVPGKYAGKKARCKKCNSSIRIPLQTDPLAVPTLSQVLERTPAPEPLSAQQYALTDERPSEPEHSVDQTEDLPEKYKEVLLEIDRQQKSKRSLKGNIAILLITLIVFYYVGLLSSGLGYIFAIILVIFLHEAGHLLGMRIFGYRNLQMFFIPFIGAAVSGQSRNVPSYKKAIVALLGPAPGLIIGVVLLLISIVTESRIFLLLSLVFLLLNIFNLLPFFPLDGGRFLHEILFSRNRYIELIFRLIAALSLLLLALALKWWILGIIGFLGLITVQFPFKCAGIANELKRSFSPYRLPSSEQNTPGNVPVDLYKRAIDMIYKKFTSHTNVKMVARNTMDVVDRFYSHPPKPLLTVGLLFSYLLLFLLPLVAFVGIAINSDTIADMFIHKEIVTYEGPDGNMLKKQQASGFGYLLFETDLSPDGNLYHGKSFAYYTDGSVREEGHWKNGRRHGQWKSYTTQGDLQSVTEYDNGKFISNREVQDGEWVEISWDDLPTDKKERIETHTREAPHGPKDLKKD